jgi:hypothetical protein
MNSEACCYGLLVTLINPTKEKLMDKTLSSESAANFQS